MRIPGRLSWAPFPKASGSFRFGLGGPHAGAPYHKNSDAVFPFQFIPGFLHVYLVNLVSPERSSPSGEEGSELKWCPSHVTVTQILSRKGTWGYVLLEQGPDHGSWPWCPPSLMMCHPGSRARTFLPCSSLNTLRSTLFWFPAIKMWLCHWLRMTVVLACKRQVYVGFLTECQYEKGNYRRGGITQGSHMGEWLLEIPTYHWKESKREVVHLDSDL